MSPRRSKAVSRTARPLADPPSDGSRGWDEYAAYYDWENTRTLGTRDVAFWQHFTTRIGGRVLELGCGTGRITLPLARAGVPVVGIDRSGAMLDRARRRLRRARAGHAVLARGDLRCLPFLESSFDIVIAPYGVLQSLTTDRALATTLADVARLLSPGGRFAIDLVPDVPAWREYTRRVALQGRLGPKGPRVTLVESVRQDRKRRLTIFDHEYIEGRGSGRRVTTFRLTFRTLPIPALARRLDRAGFRVDAVLGDYQGAPIQPDADTWIVLATRR
jgi:ubiquinone/menaquinone biosynthesis C-methylase UbiE